MNPANSSGCTSLSVEDYKEALNSCFHVCYFILVGTLASFFIAVNCFHDVYLYFDEQNTKWTMSLFYEPFIFFMGACL